MVLLRWAEKFNPGDEGNLLYGGILFCCVLLIYSVDHLFDLIKYEQKNDIVASYHYSNVFISVFFASAMGALVAFGADKLDFRHFGIPVIPAFIYVFSVLGVLPHVRGFKEIVIAITVAIAVCYPLLNAHISIFFELLVPTLLVCYLNLLLFGFFEKPKDDYYGFKTIYSGKKEYEVFKHLWISFLVVSVLLAGLYFWLGATIFPYWAIAVLYWLMILFNKKLAQWNAYRWVADLILILMMFI